MRLRTSILLLGLAGCNGAGLQGALDQADQSEDQTGTALTDEEEAAVTDDATDEATDSEDADAGESAGRAVFDLMRALDQQQKLAVADCAGFGAEARALFAKEEELRAAKDRSEEGRDALHVLHDALHAKVDELKDALYACKEQLAESDFVVKAKAVADACKLPAMKRPPPPPPGGPMDGEGKGEGFGLHGDGGQGFGGGERGPGRPPKKGGKHGGKGKGQGPDLAALSSETCVAAQADAQSLLDSLTAAEETTDDVVTEETAQ